MLGSLDLSEFKMSEGRGDQARKRASLWLARLERMRDPALAALFYRAASAVLAEL